MRESGKFKGLELKGESIYAYSINPINNITNQDKFNALVYDFTNNGYSGRPIVVIDMGSEEYQAVTGSHRIFAARHAEIDIPTKIIPYSEELEDLLTAKDDDERVDYAKELYDSKIIDVEAFNLIQSEVDINFDESENELIQETLKAKAALLEAQEKQKKAVAKSELKASKKYDKNHDKIKEDVKKAEPHMDEYKEFLDKMKGKYSNIWAEMEDDEMSKLEELERLAYSG